MENNNQEYSQQEQAMPRRRKRRKKKRYFLKLCIFFLLCGGALALLHSNLFTVEKIKVSDAVQFTAEDIQKTAGIKEGMQLFSFSTGEAENKLEADPHIAKAHISRGLFSGLVSINIEERLEAAAVKEDKQYIIIDKKGTVLEIAERQPKLTIIEGVTATAAQENQPVRIKEEVPYKRAKQLLAAIEDSSLYFKKLDVSNTVVKGYFTDKLYCRGKSQNIVEGIESENLQAVVYDLAKKKITKGVISVGDGPHYSFHPKEKSNRSGE